jgi:hypothetical protein
MPNFHEFWVFYIGLVSLCARPFFRSYLGKKGENLATREDTAAIARQLGEVQTVFAEKLEALAQSNRALLQRDARQHDLSMAAVDKRLEIHQEAFARLFHIYFNAHKEDASAMAEQHLQWWRENCLYLSEESSLAFRDACVAARMHRDMIGKIPHDALEENWASIDGAWEKIANDVKLPKIGALAREYVKRET